MSKVIALKRVLSKSQQKPLVLFTTPQADVFVPWGMFRQAATSPNLDSYIGGNVEFEFYSKGEKMFNDAECTADNILVKRLTLTQDATVVAKAEHEFQKEQTQKFDDYAAYARRKREEDDAKAKLNDTSKINLGVS